MNNALTLVSAIPASIGLYYLAAKQNNDARLDALATEVETKDRVRAKTDF